MRFIKKNWSLSVFLAAIIFLGMVFSSCGTNQETVNSRLKIGVTVYDSDDAFLQEMIEEMREIAKQQEDFTVTLTVRGADSNQRTQDDQVQELIDNGCNILFVNLVDRTDPSNIIELARENDVPIVFFNRELVREDLMQWDGLYYVGARAEQSGILQGEEIASYIEKHPEVDKNNDGKIQYVILKGEPGHQDAIIRTESVVDTLLEKEIQLDKLSYEVANWNRAQAENRMSQLIAEYRGEIELVIGNNDEMALGAISAYDKANMTETARPVFFGIDGTTDAMDALHKGKLQGTVYNNAIGQADVMMEIALHLYKGESLEDLNFLDEKYVYLDYEKIEGDN